MQRTEKENSVSVLPKHEWQIVGLVILCIRFVQGWIFWSGGARRFIYDPQKLNPDAPEWMANKLQSAMPGALLGINHLISWLLQHFTLLYIAIIVFSLVELFAGAALIGGLLTRLAGATTAFVSVALMLIFGWQGATCVDEWTMAVSNFAMGMTLALAGSYIYSLDSYLLKRYPTLITKRWFLLLGSGPWKYSTLKYVSRVALLITILFTLTTYNYYRGAIFSAYHVGPVNPATHHLTLNNGNLMVDGSVIFNAYVDQGTEATPSFIMRIELVNAKENVIEMWEEKKLSELSSANIKNDYAYNRIHTGKFGIVAPLGAKATILLPANKTQLNLPPDNYELHVFTVDGQQFNLRLNS